MFGNPELYAKAFPHSWEAEQFRANEYNMSIFTLAILHPDYASKTTPTYAQAAGSGQEKGKKGKRKATATKVVRTGDIKLKTRSSLPLASRRFFAPRSEPTSAKKYLASDPSALRPDASDVASAFSTP